MLADLEWSCAVNGDLRLVVAEAIGFQQIEISPYYRAGDYLVPLCLLVFLLRFSKILRSFSG